MKKMIFLLLALFFIAGCAEEEIKIPETGGVNMKITSSAFKNGDMIPAKYTCQGEDVNPQLKIEGVPASAKSLALIVDDPDAPMGTWVHWLVKDMPINTKEIKENSVPGEQVVNDFRKEDYGGPCPPSGTHRYFFRLYALDAENLEASNKRDFYRQAEEHKIEEAVLMGRYSKS